MVLPDWELPRSTRRQRRWAATPGRSLAQHFAEGPGARKQPCAERCRPWEAQARTVSSLVQHLPLSAPLQSREHGLGHTWALGLGSTLLSGFFIELEDRSVGHLFPPSNMPHRTGQLTLAPLRAKASQGLRTPGRGKSWSPHADRVGMHSPSATGPSASGQSPDLSGRSLYPCKMSSWVCGLSPRGLNAAPSQPAP